MTESERIASEWHDRHGHGRTRVVSIIKAVWYTIVGVFFVIASMPLWVPAFLWLRG